MLELNKHDSAMYVNKETASASRFALAFALDGWGAAQWGQKNRL
jgi:hypothetical protein